MGAQKNTQKASAKKKSPTLQYLFDLESNNGHFIVHTTTKKSSFETENEEFLSMISYCTFVFTFIDPSESPSQQDLKRSKLTQLLSNIKTSTKPLLDDQRILSPLFSMLSANLFRPLPPPLCNSSNPSEFPDEDDPLTVPTPAWPHLQIVYDILLRLVLHCHPENVRRYIDHRFLLSLLSLFHSEDPRERDSLKNVFHRIYSKFTFYRSFMRKSMSDVFLQFIVQTDHRHCGMGDLLEIWGSIINGFAVPLKEEHKQFLMRVLIPLHKPKGMPSYHRQLSYCVAQFVQKEPVLGGSVIRGILRNWPITNCQKEVLLLGVVEDLVESMDSEQYMNLAKPLCTQICRCLSSLNSQVAERALYIWNNEQFVKMASVVIEEVFPVVVEAIENNLKWHWSKSVRDLTSNVKMMLEEMEPILYPTCLEGIESRESMAAEKDLKRKQNWDKIEMAAAAAATAAKLHHRQQQQLCSSVKH